MATGFREQNEGCECGHDRLPLNHYVTHDYQGKCSCGWLGQLWSSEAAANDELARHQRGEV